MLGAGALLLTGCANLTADQTFYHNDDNELVYDFAYSVELNKADATTLVGASTRLAVDSDGEGLEDYGAVCDALFDEASGDVPSEGSDRLPNLGQRDVLSETDLQYADISFDEGGSTIECTITLNEVPMSDTDPDGLLGGIEVWHDDSEGIIYAMLDPEGDFEETWIDRFADLQGEGSAAARILADADFIFDFPGNVITHDTGALVEQRNYDGTVDRTRLANQDVESANIVHITAEELVENEGFQVAADDGAIATWAQWLIYGAAGLLIFVAVWMMLLFARRQQKAKKRRAPAKRALDDPHKITLDNPNPYQESRKKSGNLPTAPAKAAPEKRELSKGEPADGPEAQQRIAQRPAQKSAEQRRIEERPAESTQKPRGASAGLPVPQEARRQPQASQSPPAAQQRTQRRNEGGASTLPAVPAAQPRAEREALQPAPQPKNEPASSSDFIDDSESAVGDDESTAAQADRNTEEDTGLELSSDMFFTDEGDDDR